MRGFPRVIATVQDFENLLGDKDMKQEAIRKLEELMDFDDRTVTVALKPKNKDDPDGEWKTIKIRNPHPIHRQRGFLRWRDVVALNAKHTRGKSTIKARKAEILGKYSKAEIDAAEET